MVLYQLWYSAMCWNITWYTWCCIGFVDSDVRVYRFWNRYKTGSNALCIIWIDCITSDTKCLFEGNLLYRQWYSLIYWYIIRYIWFCIDFFGIRARVRELHGVLYYKIARIKKMFFFRWKRWLNEWRKANLHTRVKIRLCFKSMPHECDIES